MNGIGPWPWTGAMDRGHGQGPWTGAIDGGQSWWRTPNLAPVSGGFRLARYVPEWP